MARHPFWILFLGCLAVCYAAPTVAPTDAPSDQELAEVKHQTRKKTLNVAGHSQFQLLDHYLRAQSKIHHFLVCLELRLPVLL